MVERFRWEEVYARLERARRAIEAGWARSPEETGRILRARAQALARPQATAETAAETRELLVFSLANERYGIDTAHVLEVIPPPRVTPVPGTPPCYLGVVNHRGRILPVLDLRRLFALAGQGAPAGSRVVTVEAGGMTFGIFADAVAGTIRVEADAVAPPPPALAGEHQAFLQGVTGEMVAVLDLEAMAQDPRIAVNEAVG